MRRETRFTRRVPLLFQRALGLQLTCTPCRQVRLEALEVERRRRDSAFSEARASLTNQLSEKRDKCERVELENATLRESYEQLCQSVEEAIHEVRDAEEQAAMLEERVEAARSFCPLTYPRTHPKEVLRKQAKKVVAFRANVPLCLPLAARQLCIHGKYMSSVPHGVVWPPGGGTTHCSVISPAFYYRTQTGNAVQGEWQKTPSAELHCGEEIEFFYRESGLWQYLGTYRCIGKTALTLPEIKELGPTYVNNIVKETIQDRKTTPPVIANTIQQMYDMAVLQVVCSGWLRVAYNQDLAAALLSSVAHGSSTSKQAQGAKKSVIPRKRAPGGVAAGGRQKKRKV
ncbi:hypothetical protein OH77DRAFT_458351 [Trametes cingulata]|nr:hypothetical protein OH77DRAFT_458351 [Trametes cingulata]